MQRRDTQNPAVLPILGDYVVDDGSDFGQGSFQIDGVNSTLRLSPSDLSTHVLLLGTTGSGKTNAIRHLLRAIRSSMTPDDVMIVFDTKGDYLREFYRAGTDVVVAHRELDNPGHHEGPVVYERWNLFGEVLIDSIDFRRETIAEIARTMYDDSVRTSKDPFFPTAAQEVTRAVMEGMLRSPKVAPDNSTLLSTLRDYNVTMDLLRSHPDLSYATWYILDGNAQAQGVVSCIHNMTGELFTGSFGEAGSFSIRDFVQRRGGRTLFLEYDVRSGRVLTPVFRILIDLAIKESLSREKPSGNVYIIIDEFGLLPNLQHIDDGICFGRELGVKFVVGTQNVNQILGAYGKERGASILSAFGTLFAFRMNDRESRDVVTNRFGEYRRRMVFPPLFPQDPPFQQVDTGKIIEDIHISTLPPHHCIVCLPSWKPRAFAFQYVPPPPLS